MSPDLVEGTTVGAPAVNGTVPPAGDVRIVATGLQRTFGHGAGAVEALGPVDFQVREGEFFSIVGPSGCGKSTLLRVIAGLANPSAGEMRIQHRDSRRPLSAMVFQDHSIYPWKTVEDNVRLGLDLAGGMTRVEKRRRVGEWLERLGLSDFAGSYPSKLSGGMRQRVAIARALVIEPEIILMDEPFAALDAQLRTILQDELVDLWEADRRTVVFVTHSLEEAIFLSDRVVVMSARPGRFCAEYDVPFARPRSHALRGEAAFAELQQEIWDVLRGEVDRQLGTQRGARAGTGGT